MKKRNSFIFLTVMILAIMWAAAAGAEEIVVGYTGPLSGPAAEYGQDCLNGIDMAVNEINAQGGITVNGKKYTFRFEKMDDKTKPEIAVSNALQLRKEHKAIAVFSPLANTIVALMKMNEERRNEFLLMGYTSVPGISEKGNKLMITLAMPFTVYVDVYTDLAWEKGWRKGAMVVTAGAYGEAWRKVFAGAWIKKGGTIVFDKPANYYTRTDFAGPLAEALATHPDFLLIGGPSSTTALVVEQARAKGYEGGFILIDQAKIDAIVQVMAKPLNLEGSFGTAILSMAPFPTTDTFVQNYTTNYKRKVVWENVLNYTAMQALARAIGAAGTADDVRAIRAAFPKIVPILGDKYPWEVFAITPGGLMVSPAIVQTMKHGKFTQPHSYVWWAKTEKEFEQVKKLSKGSVPMVWKNVN